MKKTLLLLPFIALLSRESKAQIVFEKEDIFGPSSLVNVKTTDVNALSLPATGPDQAWDYSKLTGEDTVKLEFVLPASSEYADKLPGATLIGNINQLGNNTIGSFELGNQGLYLKTVYDPGTDKTVPLVKPRLGFPAPISFDNEIIYDSSRMIISDGPQMKMVQFTRQNFTALGYGDITTPAGTYENTLLVKAVETIIDSVTSTINGIEVPRVSQSTKYTYMWLQKDNTHSVVFDMQVNADNEVLKASYYFKDQIASVASEKENKNFIKHYPIPADNELTIELNNPLEGTFKLFTLDGKQQLESHVNPTTAISIPLGDIESGVYFYEIKSLEGNKVRNKVVITH